MTTSAAKNESGSTPEAELAELRAAVLGEWQRTTTEITTAISDLQRTFSWRVTSPLRVGDAIVGRGTASVTAAGSLRAIALAKRGVR